MDPKEADDRCAWEASPDSGLNSCFDGIVQLDLHKVFGIHLSVIELSIQEVGSVKFGVDTLCSYPGSVWTATLVMTTANREGQ